MPCELFPPTLCRCENLSHISFVGTLSRASMVQDTVPYLGTCPKENGLNSVRLV